ncbi:hypothetical protein, partial [Micromonospora sp. NPDC001898]|uniref:hypothetical protein n=1 Tax=Micromonospora sp. NPDC001898 TaxID=3364221 RepID=UPI0036A9BC0B
PLLPSTRHRDRPGHPRPTSHPHQPKPTMKRAHASKHLKMKVSDDTLREVASVIEIGEPPDFSITPARLLALSEKSQFLADRFEDDHRKVLPKFLELHNQRMSVKPDSDSDTVDRIDDALAINRRDRGRLRVLIQHYQDLADQLSQLASEGSGANGIIPKLGLARSINQLNNDYNSRFPKL